MVISITTLISVLGVLASSGIVGYLVNLGIKSGKHDTAIAFLKASIAEKHEELSGVKSEQSDMSKRLTAVEEAVVSLKELAPELRKFGELAVKMDTVIDLSTKRLNRLEDKVFAINEE